MEPYHGASRRHGRHSGMHAQLRGIPCRQPPDGKAGDPPLAQPPSRRQALRRTAGGHRAGIHGEAGIRRPALHHFPARGQRAPPYPHRFPAHRRTGQEDPGLQGVGTFHENLPGAGTEIRTGPVNERGTQGLRCHDSGGIPQRRSETPDRKRGQTGPAGLPFPLIQGIQGPARTLQRDGGRSTQECRRKDMPRAGLCGTR